MPGRPQDIFVKRVIGVGGDRIETRDADLFVNGHKVPRCPLGKGKLPRTAAPGKSAEVDLSVESLGGRAYIVAYATAPEYREDAIWDVPPGQSFVMGDNRDESYDTRNWFDTLKVGLPQNLVLGEPDAVWMSETAEGEPDWSRVGLRLSVPTLPSSLSALRPALDRCLANPPLSL